MSIASIEVTVVDNATGATFVDTTWTSFSGLGTSLKECKAPKTSKKQKPGNADLVLSGPMTERPYMAEWINASFVNPKTENPFRDLTIVLRDELGGEARRLHVFDCFPTSWDPGEYSPSSNVACETIVCKMQRVELA